MQCQGESVVIVCYVDMQVYMSRTVEQDPFSPLTIYSPWKRFLDLKYNAVAHTIYIYIYIQ